MNSIWSNLYDRFKDRRYGLLFIISGVASVGLLVAGKVIIEVMGSINWEPYSPGIIIFGLTLLWRKWRQLCRPRERLKMTPLSYDEVRKARSKLVRSQKVG